MTIDEQIQVLQTLKALGVSGSAKSKHGSVELSLQPVKLEGPGLVVSLDAESHWVSSPGNIADTVAVSFS